MRIAFACLCAAVWSSAQAAPPPLPAWVTGQWTVAEQRVAQVYLAAMGRAPDIGGLNYWVNSVGGAYSNPSIAQIYNAIEGTMNGARSLVAPMVEDNPTLVRYVYAFVLGKAYEDDPGGVDYWTQNLNNGTYTRGSFVETLYWAAAGTSEPRSRAIFDNRQVALEAAVKAQRMPGARQLAYQDLVSLIRRIGDSTASYNQAMDDLYTLTQTTGARPTGPVFDQAVSWSALWNAAWAYPSGNGARVHRYIAWYNSAGDMMVVNAYFPANYGTQTNWNAIVTLHGGGWRNGVVELINGHNVEFAKDHVVFSPAYRLTALGYRAPAQKQDVLDFMQLIRANAAALKLNSARIHLWGFSAGGHLAMQAGLQTNQGCVAGMSAPVDLRDAQNYGPWPDNRAILREYIAHLMNPALPSITKDSESPRLQLAGSGSTTKFFMMYGTSDSVVLTGSQYADWTSNTHPRVRVQPYSGQDHFLAGVLPGTTGVYAKSREFFNTTCHQAW